MNFFSLLSLVITLISTLMGFFVYNKDIENPVNKLFFILCLSIAYVAFAQFEYSGAESFNKAYFWIKVSAFWPLPLSLALHFVLVFVKGRGLR